MTLHIPVALRDDLLDLLVDAIDAGSGPGTIEIRSGTQPANADATATGTVLVTFTCEDPAFSPASGGVVSIDADPDLSAAAVASGTATWARVLDSDDNVVFDGSVGTSGADFIITSTTITSGQTVTLVSGNIALPA